MSTTILPSHITRRQISIDDAQQQFDIELPYPVEIQESPTTAAPSFLISRTLAAYTEYVKTNIAIQAKGLDGVMLELFRKRLAMESLDILTPSETESLTLHHTASARLKEAQKLARFANLQMHTQPNNERQFRAIGRVEECTYAYEVDGRRISRKTTSGQIEFLHV